MVKQTHTCPSVCFFVREKFNVTRRCLFKVFDCAIHSILAKIIFFACYIWMPISATRFGEISPLAPNNALDIGSLGR